MQATPVADRRELRVPSMLEIIGVFVTTGAITLLIAQLMLSRLQGPTSLEMINLASHLPILLIPWAWYRWRVAPHLAPQHRSLLRWPFQHTGLLVLFALGFGLVKFLAEIPSAISQAPPLWLTNLSTILVRAGFQGVFVGLSEEMLFRPGLHLPLRLRVSGVVGRSWWRLSYAGIITAVLFGALHMTNVFLGQSLGGTAVQAAYAGVIGLLLGWFYERSDYNYLGCAVLHNLHNVSSVVAAILFTPR